MEKERIIYRGRVITLITKSVRLPNANVVRLEVIRHPGAALIVPFLDENRIILLRQFRPVIGAYLYELPAGTISQSETALACAKREGLALQESLDKRLVSDIMKYNLLYFTEG